MAKKKGAGKVQHRGLRETFKGDIMALETVVILVDRAFDDQEMEDNEDEEDADGNMDSDDGEESEEEEDVAEKVDVVDVNFSSLTIE